MARVEEIMVSFLLHMCRFVLKEITYYCSTYIAEDTVSVCYTL